MEDCLSSPATYNLEERRVEDCLLMPADHGFWLPHNKTWSQPVWCFINKRNAGFALFVAISRVSCALTATNIRKCPTLGPVQLLTWSRGHFSNVCGCERTTTREIATNTTKTAVVVAPAYAGSHSSKVAYVLRCGFATMFRTVTIVSRPPSLRHHMALAIVTYVPAHAAH